MSLNVQEKPSQFGLKLAKLLLTTIIEVKIVAYIYEKKLVLKHKNVIYKFFMFNLNLGVLMLVESQDFVTSVSHNARETFSKKKLGKEIQVNPN